MTVGTRETARRVAATTVVVLVVAAVGLLIAQTAVRTRQSERPAARFLQGVPRGLSTTTSTKVFCRSYRPTDLPNGLTARDRNLVPYSHSVLGVDARWADAQARRSVQVLDGGYVDDITEPYDALAPAPSTTVHGSLTTVLTTIFLRRQIVLGYWREAKVQRPCDVHAVVMIGLTRPQAYRVLRSMR